MRKVSEGKEFRRGPVVSGSGDGDPVGGARECDDSTGVALSRPDRRGGRNWGGPPVPFLWKCESPHGPPSTSGCGMKPFSDLSSLGPRTGGLGARTTSFVQRNDFQFVGEALAVLLSCTLRRVSHLYPGVTDRGGGENTSPPDHRAWEGKSVSERRRPLSTRVSGCYGNSRRLFRDRRRDQESQRCGGGSRGIFTSCVVTPFLIPCFVVFLLKLVVNNLWLTRGGDKVRDPPSSLVLSCP